MEQINKKKAAQYRFMRQEIQALIMKTIKRAEKGFRDVELKKLSSQIQFDYGVGGLTVQRIIDNLIELKFLVIENGLIKSVIRENGK